MTPPMRDTSLLSRETSEVAGYLSFNGELFAAEATALKKTPLSGTQRLAN